MVKSIEVAELPKRLGWFDSNGEVGWVSNMHRLTEEEASEMADVYDFVEEADCEISWISKINREAGDKINQVAYEALKVMQENSSFTPAMAYTVAYQKITSNHGS